jgi:hypothetical protein
MKTYIKDGLYLFYIGGNARERNIEIRVRKSKATVYTFRDEADKVTAESEEVNYVAWRSGSTDNATKSFVTAIHLPNPVIRPIGHTFLLKLNVEDAVSLRFYCGNRNCPNSYGALDYGNGATPFNFWGIKID